jgi:NAD dependent epimerase/dehydratase
VMKSSVLVTGAAGFIGSHLVEECVERGYRVRAFVRYNSQNDWGWLESNAYRHEFEIYRGDIRDFDSVQKAITGCDVVFHLAALIGIPYSYVSPLAYIKTNVEGTYNVLEAGRQLETEKIVITSTSETYGTAQYVPIDEMHPLVGQSPYSASKIGADALALSYHKSFGLPVKIIRPFNTYGPRQSARAVITTIIVQLMTGAKSISLGNLQPTRDLTFVRDTVNGFLAVAECEKLTGDVANVGMNEEISIGSLLTEISELMGKRIEVKTESERIRPEKSEVERLRCDNHKIMSLTGWRPSYSLRKGLTATIEWLGANLSRYKPEIYNV